MGGEGGDGVGGGDVMIEMPQAAKAEERALYVLKKGPMYSRVPGHRNHRNDPASMFLSTH